MARAAAVVGTALTVAAVVHRNEFRSPTYTRSPLVTIELALAGILALILVAQPVIGIVYLAQRHWRGLGVVGVTVAVCLAFLVVAIAIDATTLLYAT